MNIKAALIAARTRAGLTQGALAKLCGWKQGQSRISNYEKGLREPTLHDLDAIAKACGTDLVSLIHTALGTTPSSSPPIPMSKQAQRVATVYDRLAPTIQDHVRGMVEALGLPGSPENARLERGIIAAQSKSRKPKTRA